MELLGDCVHPSIEEKPTLEIESPEPKIELNLASNGKGNIKISKNGSNGKYFSPLVRSIAEKEGINQETLDSL